MEQETEPTVKSRIPIGHIRYRIATSQDTWGERAWHFIISKHVRTKFKRSGRIGWKFMGWVKTPADNQSFATRKEALTIAQKLRDGLS